MCTRVGRGHDPGARELARGADANVARARRDMLLLGPRGAAREIDRRAERSTHRLRAPAHSARAERREGGRARGADGCAPRARTASGLAAVESVEAAHRDLAAAVIDDRRRLARLHTPSRPDHDRHAHRSQHAPSLATPPSIRNPPHSAPPLLTLHWDARAVGSRRGFSPRSLPSSRRKGCGVVLASSSARAARSTRARVTAS